METYELNDISNSFIDAWKDYFGQTMYYVKQVIPVTPTPSTIYKESKIKTYDYAGKVSFYGIYREEVTEEEINALGVRRPDLGIVIAVTDELYDKGITSFSDNDLIQVTLRNNVVKTFNIVAIQGKVQLSNRKIFTRFGVVQYG